MSTVLKITLGVIIGGLVLIGGCFAILGAGVEEAQRESDATAITPAEYKSAKTGRTTEAQMRRRFGEPDTADEIQTEDIEGIPDSGFQQNCLYYGKEGDLASLYQFCFDGNGKLESKSAF